MSRVLIAVLLIAFQLYALVEAAGTKRPRTMNQIAWILVTTFVPVLGPILWFWAGRPRRQLPPPDDNPDFFRK
ncbi:MAG: hypothetical protein RL038_721 [Actinomycetota bacterium]